MKHSIIVGFGLAGFHYAQQLKKDNKEFLIIDKPENSASRNAAGICNPTVLKRYTLAWKGSEFLNYAMPNYKRFESEFKTTVFHPLPIHRHFFSAGEQNSWVVASQEEGLNPFLESTFHTKSSEGIRRNFGYGSVKNVGRLDISSMLEAFLTTLDFNQKLEERFDYAALEIYKEKVVYKGVEAKNVVFCEGFGLKNNPWFNYLPLIGSKGEYLKIKAPKLSQKQIIKGGIFISPIGQDLFLVGATFNPNNKVNEISAEGLKWIRSKLETLIDAPYEVIHHKACIRPTVSDRRPLLGQHPEHNNLYVFNGLGTRGVLMAPLLSCWLHDFIHLKKELPQAVAINRFEAYFCIPNKSYV